MARTSARSRLATYIARGMTSSEDLTSTSLGVAWRSSSEIWVQAAAVGARARAQSTRRASAGSGGAAARRRKKETKKSNISCLASTTTEFERAARRGLRMPIGAGRVSITLHSAVSTVFYLRTRGSSARAGTRRATVDDLLEGGTVLRALRELHLKCGRSGMRGRRVGGGEVLEGGPGGGGGVGGEGGVAIRLGADVRSRDEPTSSASSAVGRLRRRAAPGSSSRDQTVLPRIRCQTFGGPGRRHG